MNYIRNMRPPRARINNAIRKDNQRAGFAAGVLAMSWIAHDAFDMDDDEVGEMATQAFKFMQDVGNEKIDIAQINRTLEEMTGINILEG